MSGSVLDHARRSLARSLARPAPLESAALAREVRNARRSCSTQADGHQLGRLTLGGVVVVEAEAASCQLRNLKENNAPSGGKIASLRMLERIISSVKELSLDSADVTAGIRVHCVQYVNHHDRRLTSARGQQQVSGTRILTPRSHFTWLLLCFCLAALATKWIWEKNNLEVS